jgi:subtilase family serine protease
MMPGRKGALATFVASTVLLQAVLLTLPVAPPAAGATQGPDDGGGRVTAGQLLVFQDDFASGTIDTTKWVHWTGDWSVDNVAWNPAGGIYTGDNFYLTESPYANNAGAPLDGNGNGGLYYDNETAMVETSWIDLQNLTAPRLEFRQMYDIPSAGDGALVYVWSDASEKWTVIEPDSGYPSGSSTGWTGKVLSWEAITLRLDAFAGSRVRIGFLFKSSLDGIEGDGWMIDDVEVGGRPAAALPDLKFGNTKTYVGGYPVTSAPSGNVVDLVINVLNEGKAAAPPFEVTAYTANPLAGGERIGQTVALDGLKVGGTLPVTFRWIALPGHWKPVVYVDAPNQVPEENERNNALTLSFDSDGPASGDVGVVSMRFDVAGRTVQGAGVGDLVTMVVVLRNYGQGPVTTPMALRAYDGDPVGGGKLVGDEQPQINAVEPERNRTFDIHWRPLAGNHTIFVGVWPIDPKATLDDNAANNATSAAFVVTDAPPVNLVAQSLQFIVAGHTTTACFEDQDVHVIAVIANAGTGPFKGALDIAVYDGDPDSGGVEVGHRAFIGVLGPSETATIEMDWRGVLGTHAMSLFADPQNLVYEANEDDNQRTTSVTVTRVPLPDLEIASMRLVLNGEPIDPAVGTSEGAQVEVNVTVRNIGNDKTKAPTVTRLYLGNPALGGKELTSFTVPEGLNVDEQFTGVITWAAVRPSVKSQTPVLFILADATDKERETDELNNFDMLPIKVGPPMPDLKVMGMAVRLPDGSKADRITFGVPVKIEVTVKNVGTDISFQAANIEFYLDTTEPAGLIGSTATQTLDVGESTLRSITWQPDPLKLAGGQHTLFASVDPSHEIAEASDANNVGTVPLFIDADARPNLLVANLEVLSHDRVVDRVTKGDTALVRIQVLNLGQAPLYTPAQVELAQGQLSAGALPTTWTISAMAVGGNRTFEANWTFTSSEPLTVYLDRSNRVRETNENDNIATLDIQVVPPAKGANVLVIAAILGLAILLLVLLSLFVTRRAPVPAEVPAPTPMAPVFEPTPAPVVVDVPAEPQRPAPAPAVAPVAAPVAPAAPPPPPRPAPVPAMVAAPGPGMSAEVRVLPPPPPVPKCPSCGEEIDPNWILCPFCDTPLK